LTYRGSAVLEYLDCHEDNVTVLYQSADTLECRGSGDPLGTYGDTSDQCTAAGNACSHAYFLPQ